MHGFGLGAAAHPHYSIQLQLQLLYRAAPRGRCAVQPSDAAEWLGTGTRGAFALAVLREHQSCINHDGPDGPGGFASCVRAAAVCFTC